MSIIQSFFFRSKCLKVFKSVSLRIRSVAEVSVQSVSLRLRSVAEVSVQSVAEVSVRFDVYWMFRLNVH